MRRRRRGIEPVPRCCVDPLGWQGIDGSQVRRNDGLRKLLIAERERGLKRWPVSTGDEYLDGLRSGGPVLVSSSQLMRALMHARLPCGTIASVARTLGGCSSSALMAPWTRYEAIRSVVAVRRGACSGPS